MNRGVDSRISRLLLHQGRGGATNWGVDARGISHGPRAVDGQHGFTKEARPNPRLGLGLARCVARCAHYSGDGLVPLARRRRAAACSRSRHPARVFHVVGRTTVLSPNGTRFPVGRQGCEALVRPRPRLSTVAALGRVLLRVHRALRRLLPRRGLARLPRARLFDRAPEDARDLCAGGGHLLA